ncbi:glycosyltransferase 87 family protein [Planosporangium mesophilum]|nr:glycosyltransferase 87 family protein [Planosporangium mesophilum]NJC83438.1 DUF2029 domain-containing protein [Planosporangium mesophilum]
MVVLALAITGWLTSGLWIDPNHRAMRVNASDQSLFEWLLSYAADTLRNGHDPFFTSLLNAPLGANLAVNTAVSVLGWVLAPVTLLLSPSVSFAIALTFGIAATPVAWYLLLSRTVVRSRAAAIVGGLFCGFAPGLVSHANAHVNFASGYLIPLIVWRVLELRRPGRAVRNGMILGALVAVQYSLGGETLFFTALTCGVFLGFWLLTGHREPRDTLVTFARGLGATAVTAFALLAYPLWMMFFGPGHYHGTGFDQVQHSEDLLAYGAFPRRSMAGMLGLDSRLAANPTEENSFFGVTTLLILVGAGVLALRARDLARRRLARAVLYSVVAFAVLSLGPELHVAGYRTGFPLPYALLRHAPLFDSALPGRLALIVTALAGVLLALGLDRLPELRRPRLVAAAVAIGLLPIVPVPLLTMERSPVPHFFSSGAWRGYVEPGETLIPLPVPSDWIPDGQRWQTAALSSGDGATFRIPAGFFLGPDAGGRGRIGPVPRWTQTTFAETALAGNRPLAITPVMEVEARKDLEYWGGRVVVMPAGAGQGTRWARNHDLVLELATELYGQPTRVDDVWLWRVAN